MRRVRIEYRMMLCNWWCVRPIELDCTSNPSAKPAATPTSIEFQPFLLKQRDHADRPGHLLRGRLAGESLGLGVDRSLAEVADH
jgi:hypothetical protein